MAVVGKDIRFTCSAASSSSSPMTFAWKKDNEVLVNADMENFAHVRAQDGEVMEYTTILHLRRVTFGHEGRYQCVITNHFGSTYSHKARLTVNGKEAPARCPGARPLGVHVRLFDQSALWRWLRRQCSGVTGTALCHTVACIGPRTSFKD